MKWKKVMSVLIAAVFVISGVAVVANSVSAQEADPQYIQRITLEVRTTIETGLGDTAVGDLDAFIHSVEGQLFDGISDDWKANLGTWPSTGSYNNLLFNPAYEKDTEADYPDTELTPRAGGLPVIAVDGEWQFNPFADSEIRFAINFLVDRSMILEDMYDGYGTERYMAMGQAAPGFEEYYRPIVEELGIDEADEAHGTQLIQDRMNYWAGHEGINAETGMEVTNAGTEADPQWQFGGEDIELEMIIRIEDTRLMIGHYFSDIMEDQGFVANRYEQEAGTAFANSLFSDPASMQFHMYTGGWIASTANKYQHAAMNQMYTGWYGWSPGLQIDGWWQYEEPEEIEEYGRDLMGGRAPTEEEYWEYMMEMAEYGMKSSMRVFLVSTLDYFVYDDNRVAEAATDVVTGWAGIYSPRTLKIRDEEGHLTLAQYSTVGSLYMDNWNRIDGSGDTYSMQQQDMARDFTMYNHPAEGVPIGIRTEYDVYRDYDWVEEDGETTLDKNVEVPSDAIDYDVDTQEWVEVGENNTAAVAVTYDWHENADGDLGTFHDGNPLTYRDVMAWYAFSKELSFDSGNGYYYGPWGTIAGYFFANVQGIELNVEGGEVTSYTIYGDYTFPVESLIASYFSQTTFKPWQVYEAARIMVAQHEDEEALWGGVAGEGETWSWSAAENWIHFISPAQGETFKAVMENMIAEDWTPAYFDTMPTELGDVDLETEIGRTIGFFDTHNHMFISQGPFRIVDIDEPNMVMEMERWGPEDGYPLALDHWEDILTVRRFELREVNMPSRVEAGQEFEVEAFARIREDYPERRVYAADEGEVTVRIFVPGQEDRVATVDAPVEDGRFLVDIPSEMTVGLDGSYDVRIEGTVPGAVTPSILDRSLLVLGDPDEAEISVSNFEVDPIEGPAPMDIEVSADLTNPADSTQSIQLLVGGATAETFTLDAGETRTITHIETLTEEGTYTVELGDQSIDVTVTEAIEDLEVSNFAVNPSSGYAPLDVSITADVHNPTTEAMTFEVKVAGDVIEDYTVDPDDTVSVDETHTFDDTGDYVVMVHRSRRVVNVEEEVEPEADIRVSGFNVSPTSGEAPLEVEIVATIENHGDAEGTITLYADGNEVNSWTLGAGETASVDETYEFDEEGTYTVTLGDESATVEVEEETPGFTLAVLAISAVVAVLIYRKKSDE